MARPKSRLDLLDTANAQFDKLVALIGTMSASTRSADLYYGETFSRSEAHWSRDKNLRDVLIHLFEWHKLLLQWIISNKAGQDRSFLPEPYNWKTYGDMNVEFWRKHQETSCEDAERLLAQSHRDVMRLIDGLTEAELFENKHFTWTGTTTLGSYRISATSSHYEWAIKKLRAHIKAYEAKK